MGDTAASETLTSVGGYNFSCPVFNTKPIFLQLTYTFSERLDASCSKAMDNTTIVRISKM